jgi:HSP20 family protein
MNLGDLVPWGRKERDLALRNNDLTGLGSGQFSPFMRLHQEMNRLFDDAFRDFGLTTERTEIWPRIDIAETDDGYRLTADLPGMDEKDIDLTIQEGVLTLRGEKRAEQLRGRGYAERYYGAFERRIPVGDVDRDKVKASFDKGVLTVTLPRSAEAADNMRRIPINIETRH